MKTTTPPPTRTCSANRVTITASAAPQKIYWILQRHEQPSADIQKDWGIRSQTFYPHSALTDGEYPTVNDLLNDLLTKGWKKPFKALNNTGEQIVRIEVTETGFIAVRFPTVAAARAAEKNQTKKKFSGKLPPCPFCHQANHIETINWTYEHADGSEYQGEGVRCNQCNAVAPIAAWRLLAKA